jgi:hypothetical protein
VSPKSLEWLCVHCGAAHILHLENRGSPYETWFLPLGPWNNTSHQHEMTVYLRILAERFASTPFEPLTQSCHAHGPTVKIGLNADGEGIEWVLPAGRWDQESFTHDMAAVFFALARAVEQMDKGEE